MTEATFDPAAIVAALVRHDVALVLIGGVAAEAHGIQETTFDLDVVIERSDNNCELLLQALVDLDAEHDMLSPAQHIQPSLGRLRTATGTLRFRTRSGRLDVLMEAGGETYETLIDDALEVQLMGQKVLVASLAALRRMKLAANRPKDRKLLPLIEQRMGAAQADDGDEKKT